MSDLIDLEPGKDGKVLTVIEGGKADGDKPKRKPPRPLTSKQLAFVNSILSGMDQTSAYVSAYNTSNMSRNTVWSEASRLFANPLVAARIKAGRKAKEQSALLSASSTRDALEKRLAEMGGLVDGSPHECAADRDRLAALVALGKTATVAAFIERTENINLDISPDNVERDLAAQLKKAFGSKG
jgi:hypothetical protein